MEEKEIAKVTTEERIIELSAIIDSVHWPYRVTVTAKDGGIRQNERYSNLKTAFREFWYLSTSHLNIDDVMSRV